MNVIWKDIIGYEGIYQISNTGKVKSVGRYIIKNGNMYYLKEKLLRACENNGYLHVTLRKNGQNKMYTVHRLVASAFIPNPENKPEVNHIDSNRENNTVENLEWVTGSENQLHAVRAGKKSQAKKILCIQTGQVFDSMSEADRAIGVSIGAVSKSIRRGVRCRGLSFIEI